MGEMLRILAGKLWMQEATRETLGFGAVVNAGMFHKRRRGVNWLLLKVEGTGVLNVDYTRFLILLRRRSASNGFC